MSFYQIEQAERDLFAVYQVLYANADIEMWYDWKARLEDTKFTDQCYWVVRDGVRIGGAIIMNDTVIYPFLIAPFADRTIFWKTLFSCCKTIIHIRGVLSQDVEILQSFAYRLDVTRQVMCCPTDPDIVAALPEGYSLHVLDQSVDRTALARAIREGYVGGTDYEIYGTPTEEEVKKDVERLLQIYAPNNLSLYLWNDQDQRIAGLCIAGISAAIPLRFAEIGEICVLPSYRNRRLGEYMLNWIRAKAHPYAPVVKLCVTVGNSAEGLYRKAGFIPGPRFANMSRNNQMEI
ncbi:GNAT family N-acetyltransferase [Paenibacillus sp. PR3]|uniref:GNAT family N-acetyltransferase n=1 Tax=Paenibacillus terricola TaxID=2763503 RepID=A0ABR8N1C8_9BACL|nr:GNAT family N-acetyltransferase [Paenibacillus terricola]MBD3921986.1 GNAT family N-acetyltransferase [Paenibacillus terricola]